MLPEAEEVDVQIDPGDLEIDIYRSSGPGGQSVNTTDSAVRITHEPTGIVVSMQDEKSQLQNREKAMRVLRARLLEHELAEQQSEIASERKAQVGIGERSEKIRTYNFPQDRITDHRVKLTASSIDRVLGGELDEFTEALSAEEKRRRLEAQADVGELSVPTDGCGRRRSATRSRPRRTGSRRRRRDARLDAAVLLEAAADRASRLISDPDAPLHAGSDGCSRAMVRRRVQREPVAYIVGRRGFRRIVLAVDHRVLIPRPETELLVEVAVEMRAAATP